MGPSRDGFAMGGLGSPLGCVYARLTGAVWGLSGAGAECARDVPLGVEVRRGGRQVQDHAADRADDVRPQFEESVFGVKYFCRSTSTILAGFGRRRVGRSGPAPG